MGTPRHSGLHADTAVQRRWIISRVVFIAGSALLVLLTLVLVSTALTFYWASGFGRALVEGLRIDPGFEETPLWVYPLAVYIIYYVVPVFTFLPVLLPVALTWKQPRRIVVFRRFNTRLESRCLRRVAARHLARLGHVFTLADSQIRRSLFARIPLLVGQLGFLHFRPRKVQNERDEILLGHLLNQRWRLNLNWLVSLRKVFPISTSDACWQRTVGLLLRESEVVVVDVSNFSESMAWEIEECRRRQLLPRTLFLVHRDKTADYNAALGLLARSAGDVPGPPVFVYGARDVDDPVEFRRCISKILEPQNAPAQPLSAGQVFATIAASLLISLAAVGAVLGLIAPFLFPELTGRYSPVRSQVLQSYRQTGSDAILGRMLSDDREGSLQMLRRFAINGPDTMRGTAIRALVHSGDERDIGTLIQVLGSQPGPVGDADDLKRLVRWPDLSRDSLIRLSKRLGLAGVRALIDSMETAPRLAFDDQLNREVIHPLAKEIGPDSFGRLLEAPNQAGRFVAALELGPLKNDPRVIPNLLEIVRAMRPDLGDGLYAQELLSDWPADLLGLDPAQLAPYLLGDDEAAAQAARLAFGRPDDTYLIQTLEQVPDGVGQRLLEHLVTRACGENAAGAARAHRCLARARAGWKRSMLASPDLAVRMNAVYAQAEIGDVSGLSEVLTAAKVRGKCETILFQKYECFPHLQGAIRASDLMRARLQPPVRVAVNADVVRGLPQAMHESLLRLVLASGDGDGLKDLVGALNPSAVREERGAVTEVCAGLDMTSLRQLVHALPGGSDPEQAVWLTCIAAGLQWRGQSSEEKPRFCDAAAAEGRPDLVTAWRAAGYPCGRER